MGRAELTEPAALEPPSAEASKPAFERLHAWASWLDGNAQVQDLLIPGLLAGLSIAELAIQNLLHVRGALFCVGLCLPLCLRRRYPLPVMGVISAVAFAQWLVSVPQIADAALLLTLYEVALQRSLGEVALATGIAELGAVIAALRWGPVDPLKAWVGLSALVGVSSVFGISIRQRRALLASLRERTSQLERERDQEWQLGAAAERARIAREMHDIVAHNLSVMIALADGASFAMESSPEQAAQATRRASAAGRQALGEMRRLLGVLGDQPEAQPPLAPQPGLEQLPELLERVGAAGLEVQAQVDEEARELGQGLQLMLFRVIQEGLTNVIKHAPGATRASVGLRVEPGLLELEIADWPESGSAQPLAGEVPGTGHGLQGMRERAAAYGGVLSAGPFDGGGWRVSLQIPLVEEEGVVRPAEAVGA